VYPPYPYYLPGYPPPRQVRIYDPFGAIPPFARRILDRVLP
jgi:hypothetical protein